jgi:putative CocE/NonD family hydrolase
MVDRGAQGWPLLEADSRAAEDVPFFNDWVLHSEQDAYWQAIDGTERARKISAPVMLMAGWQDPFLPTMLRDFMTIRREAAPSVASNTRLVIGPWMHADTITFPDGTTAGDYRPATIAPSVAWFDHHLLGRPLEELLVPPVRIYVMGENKWRAEQDWPLTRARPTPLYFSALNSTGRPSGHGRLGFERPAAAGAPLTYVYDPNNPVPTRGGAMLGLRAGIQQQNEVEQRPDVLVFTSDPLDTDIEVTGPVSATLQVSTTAPNTDFTVKLVDVYPDGKAYNVTDGILRRSYPVRVDTAPTEIQIDLFPTSMLFRKGHHFRVEISSSNFPHYDRNPNTGGDIARETNPLPATQTIFLDGDRPSMVVLPIVPR